MVLGEWPKTSVHSSTRIESEEQVDYSNASMFVGASMPAGSLGGSTNKYNADYFTPKPHTSKFSHLRLNELGNDGDKTLPPTTSTLEAATHQVPSISLPSPTPSVFGSANSFSIVIGTP